jgi:Domain of unknown function (DUF4396)
MAPHALEVVAWTTLALGGACALAILVDELLLGRRQAMTVMNLVHPVTALYLGPIWLWAYLRRWRAGASEDRAARDTWEVAGAVSHCGAGCTLGDIAGEWIVWAALATSTIAGATLYPEILLDVTLAWGLGIAFQYFTIVPMRRELRGLSGVLAAIRADTLSIAGFQVGLLAWMALSERVIWSPPLQIDAPGHWAMMQVGMILGAATSWPVNRALLARGWKEPME